MRIQYDKKKKQKAINVSVKWMDENSELEGWKIGLFLPGASSLPLHPLHIQNSPI
jgi:hypothetical protein